MQNNAFVVTFNGHNLTERFTITNIIRPRPSFSVSAQDNPAGGSFVFGSRPTSHEVSFDLVIRGDSTERGRLARELATWLMVDEPAPLEFGDDGGLYYMAMPNGRVGSKQLHNAEVLSLTFLVPEPYMYKTPRPVEFEDGTKRNPIGGPSTNYFGATFFNHGTAPALLRVEAHTYLLANNRFGVRMRKWTEEGAIEQSVAFVTGTFSEAGYHDCVVDSLTRTASIDGAAKPLALDDDWPEIPADGSYYFINPYVYTGVDWEQVSGSATIQERWWI